MFKVAVCDDDVQELSRLANFINRYQDEKKAALRYAAFSNALDLLETMRCGSYDVLLLDVLMPGINGLEAACEIRTFDKDIKIIFLTSSPEFAVESYAVDAYYYFLKPVTAEKLFPILDELLLEAQRAENAFCIKSASGLTRIPFHKLEFLEVINKKLYFHLGDGSVKVISGSLSDYETALLGREEFIKVHRSCIVNMECIHELNAKELLTFAKQSVPVSRLLYGQVREAYMQFLFGEKGRSF
jgi:DNA-binding LytR/AlgR family response regulator